MAPKTPPHIKGIITWTVAPMEQRVFSDLFDAKFMIAKFKRKITENMDFIPGFLMFVGVIYFGNKKHHEDQLKLRY